MPIKIMAIMVLCWLALGCSSTPKISQLDETFQLDSHSEPWEANLLLPGTLQLQLLPSQNSTVRLALSSRANVFDHPAFSLTASDHNCDTGFNIKLNYRSSNDEDITDYFSQEIPWGEPIQLTIIVNDDGSFQVRLEEEFLNGELKSPAHKVQLSLAKGESTVNKINYKTREMEQ